MELTFEAKDHIYKSVGQNKIDWLSVTSLVGLFKQPFDQEGIAAKCAINKKSKWYGKTPERIIEIWKNETDRALKLGSWYHDQRETELLMCQTLERGGVELPIVNIIEEDGIKFSPDQAMTPGIYPEHFIYLKSAGICGQADRVEVLQQAIDLFDYKTNKEIKTKAFTSWKGVTTMMTGPCSHLEDCNFNHYALQLSIYMYMMLKHNHNLKVGKMEIHHITFEKESEDEHGYPIVAVDMLGDPIVDKVTPYPVPYLKREVQAMLRYVKMNPELSKKK